MEKKKPGTKYSPKERRKRFEKWISMDMLHKATGKLPFSVTSPNEGWNKIPPCDICKDTFGYMIKKEDNKWYCRKCALTNNLKVIKEKVFKIQ